MQLKVIATGSSKHERAIRRWGVSFLIGDDVLYDTFGDPDVFEKNLKAFQIRTDAIRQVILSHDDWDHVEGLWRFLPGRRGITVTVCPRSSQAIKGRIVSLGARLVEAQAGAEVREGVFSSGELYGKAKDRVICEQSAVIRQARGLAVVCGCAHPGVDRIVRHVRAVFREPVVTLIGGFHLKDDPPEVNAGIIQELQELGVQKIAPMHCTGPQATEAIRKAFGAGSMDLAEGDVVEL